MSIELITLLLVGSLVSLLMIGMPMAFALGFVGVSFTFAFFGWDALSLISSRIYGFVNVYVLVAVPMFLLMASIMDKNYDVVLDFLPPQCIRAVAEAAIKVVITL